MWRSRRLGVVVLLGVVAIAGGHPGAAHASTQVPLTIQLNAQDTIAPCGETLCSTNVGTGTASHMGAISFYGTAVFTSVTYGVNSIQVTTVEWYAITAANGDTIDLINYATGTEDLLTGASQISGNWQITGGTGRFTGATGQGTTVGSEQATGPFTAQGSFTLAGSISSVGSLR
jgi:hypothetical protein